VRGRAQARRPVPPRARSPPSRAATGRPAGRGRPRAPAGTAQGDAVTGSSPSTGPVCGAISAVAAAARRPRAQQAEVRVVCRLRPAASTAPGGGSGCTYPGPPVARDEDPDPPAGRRKVAGSRAAPRPSPPAADPRLSPPPTSSIPTVDSANMPPKWHTTDRADPARRNRPNPAASPPGSNRTRSAGGTGRFGPGGSIASSPPGIRGRRGGRGTSTVGIAPPFLRCGPDTGPCLRLLRNGPARGRSAAIVGSRTDSSWPIPQNR
jgi:hypothetical protein